MVFAGLKTSQQKERNQSISQTPPSRTQPQKRTSSHSSIAEEGYSTDGVYQRIMRNKLIKSLEEEDPTSMPYEEWLYRVSKISGLSNKEFIVQLLRHPEGDMTDIMTEFFPSNQLEVYEPDEDHRVQANAKDLSNKLSLPKRVGFETSSKSQVRRIKPERVEEVENGFRTPARAPRGGGEDEGDGFHSVLPPRKRVRRQLISDDEDEVDLVEARINQEVDEEMVDATRTRITHSALPSSGPRSETFDVEPEPLASAPSTQEKAVQAGGTAPGVYSYETPLDGGATKKTDIIMDQNVTVKGRFVEDVETKPQNANSSWVFGRADARYSVVLGYNTVFKVRESINQQTGETEGAKWRVIRFENQYKPGKKPSFIEFPARHCSMMINALLEAEKTYYAEIGGVAPTRFHE